MTRRWPVTGVILAVLWLFVRGVELTPTRIAEEFVIGLLVGFPLAYAVRNFYSPEAAVQRSIRSIPYAIFYLATFSKELVLANFDVAYRILSPSMPIDPAVVEVPLRVETSVGITTIANSITLTPGTLTMDYDAERNLLYVHSIDGSDPEAVLEPIRKWEEYALVIFEEDAHPDDPVPEARTDGGPTVHSAEDGVPDRGEVNDGR